MRTSIGAAVRLGVTGLDVSPIATAERSASVLTRLMMMSEDAKFALGY
jgi:hypothetical protein